MFTDLKIIELASVLAGPAVGMFFAELGAKVIKVENPKTSGDITRKWKLPEENSSSPKSAYYCSVNWNKEVIFADLTNDLDFLLIKSYIQNADIIILNFKKGDDKKFFMDYENLKSINPKLIHASINGYGECDDRIAYDVVLQAETGFMSMNGTKESGPLKMPVALIDIIAAHQLKEAILIALIHRERTGEGSKVSVSLYESAIASLANQATNYLMNDKIPENIGSLHPNIAPYGETFKTHDNKYVVLAIGTDKQFFQLCQLINAHELNNNNDYNTNSKRVENRTKLKEILSKYIKSYDSSKLKMLLKSGEIPVGVVKNMAEIFEKDSAASKMILTEKENFITKRVKTIAFKTNFLPKH